MLRRMWRISINSVYMPSSRILPIAAGLLHHDPTIVAHDHAFLEIAVVASGKGAHQSIHGSQILTRGSVVIIRPGAWHAYDGCIGMSVANCVFAAEMLSEDLAWVCRDAQLQGLFHSQLMSPQHKGVLVSHLDEESTQLCLSRSEDVSAVVASTDHPNRIEQLATLALFLATLKNAATIAPIEHSVRPVGHPAVRQAIRLMESDLRHSWTVPELAAKMNIDASYLSRLFRQATTLPPMHYHNRVRLEHAAAMLIRTDESIGNVGEHVGWPDQNHFARRFRNHFGISPSRYRQQFHDKKAAVATN